MASRTTPLWLWLHVALLGGAQGALITQATCEVTLAGGKARLFRAGNPLVFAGAVSRVAGKPAAGDVVDVVDGAGSLIGWGVFNPHSMYRVRLLAHNEPELLRHRDVDELLSYRISAAASVRRACCLPSERTTAYRLINGEGDRLSGLMVDVFGHTAVAVSSAIWLEKHSDAIKHALSEIDEIDTVVWRRNAARLKQDGYEVVQDELGSAPSADLGSAPLGSADLGSAPLDSAARPTQPEEEQSIEIKEHGLSYRVEPTAGQKSGFYCDQRENRRMLAELCAGRRVLDLFCYSGAFAINAAAAGATDVVGVDSSEGAISLARSNSELNGVGERCEFIKSDVLKYLHDVPPGSFDVVICDPPKLAPSVKDLPRATTKYRKFNRMALRALKPGGVLLSCTCSGAMCQSGGFVRMMQDAARAEGRSLTLLREAGAASCHVINPAYPESAYLQCALLMAS